MGKRMYGIRIKVEGPVHIGDGNVIGKKDYFLEGFRAKPPTVSVLDAASFVKELDVRQLADYCRFLEHDSSKGLQDFLDEHPELREIAKNCVRYETETRLSKARRGTY